MIGESGYQRLENDAYYTPAWCTEALLRHVSFSNVWECASGKRNISNVLESFGVKVVSTDIDHGPNFDFLSMGKTGNDIVTNPPYSHAEQFLRYDQRELER